MVIFLLLWAGAAANAQAYPVKEDSLLLFDSSRQRPVPVTLYHPQSAKATNQHGLVILSHGYNANKPGASKSYSYLARALAAEGWLIASIQHELPGDDLIPATGIPQIVRMPFWQRGADNILFVLNTLKRIHPALDSRQVVLIGHSNGGDMTMLFAQQHPLLAQKIISLDNRRMPFPASAQPQILSLRSSDQPADEGVLPTAAQQQQYHIRIIPLKNVLHNDMADTGTADQHTTIIRYILRFLRNK